MTDPQTHAPGPPVADAGPSPAIRAALGGHDPSSEQWTAIAHDPVPVAVVAGAGSGKTAVMAARMVWMVEREWVRPSQILGLTFTNKAARELEDRILAAFAEIDPPPPEEPHIATYHSFADRLVRDHGVRVGIDPEVGLLSEAQRWQLLLGTFDRLPPFEAIDSRSAASICRGALGLADQCANHLVTPERMIAEDDRVLRAAERFGPEVALCCRRRIELAGVVRAYVDAKERARRIDFGDQVTKAVEILERFPDLAGELRARFPALLLDEYQDTNVAQRRLLQLLAPEGHNVTAVGDARQNIFQWRGSTLFNLIDFPVRHFLRAGGKAHEYLSLSRNYRCGARILDVANRIIDAVPPARRPGAPLAAHPASGEGMVGVRLLADQLEEAAFIASEIERLHGSPAGEGRPPTTWRDFAVLVRRKSHIAPIYDALAERRVPVEVVGLGGLLQVPEIVDVVAWLRAVADPGPPGNVWLARILLGPRFRIHYRDLALLARWAARHTLELVRTKEAAVRGDEEGRIVSAEVDPDEVAYSLAESLDHLDEIPGLPAEARRRLLLARGALAHLRRRANEPLLHLVQAVIDDAGIGEALDALGDDPAAARANLTSFLGAVASFAPVAGEPSLSTLLAYLDAAEEVEETLEPATPAATDSVKLMTVHQAKGLEFEVVFIPGVAARTNDRDEKVESIFPDTRTSNPMTSHGILPHSVREDAEHLPGPWLENGLPKKRASYADELKERAVEDERRLFYVGLTRGKQRVYVSAAWWYERRARPHGPSLFFDEVAASPEAEDLGREPPPESSPLVARLAERATWPPPESPDGADPLFPDGYAAEVERLLSGERSPEELLGSLGPAARARSEEILAASRRTIAALSAVRQDPAGARAGLPASLSATRVADLLAGRVGPADLARPLPERPSAARRIGSEIHRWIEEQARGLTGLADEEILDAPSAPVEASRLADLRERFRQMGFPGRRLASLDTGEPMVEVPFVLKVGDRLVRGRIDAVYETPEGGLEVVDFKTGAEVEPADMDQLDIYAAALVELGIDVGRRPLTLTYCYLATGKVSSRQRDRAGARARLQQVGPLLDDAATLPRPEPQP